MKKKKKTSIQAKTLIYLLTFNVVIIVLLWICQISIFDIYYEKEQISNMDGIVSSLKNANSDEIVAVLQDAAYQNEVCIALTNPVTNVLTTYNANMNGCALNSSNTQVMDLINQFIESDLDFKSYRFVNNTKHVSALMYGIKNNDNYMFIYSNLEDISDFTLIIKRQLMYVCILGIFIASIILPINTVKPIPWE